MRASLALLVLALVAATRVSVPGASLYLDVRGQDASAPVLLWLHGGPGAAENVLFQLYDAQLESHFVVAYWDQRGAGRSYDPDADPRELTVARHLADLDLVVDHLRAELGRDKVNLVGHSWGSALGLLYAHAHPEKVAAFVGVGQLVAELARQRAQIEFVRSEAERRDDRDALESLGELGAPPFGAKEELAVQALVDEYGGYFHTRPSFAWAMLRGVFGGYVSPFEIRSFIRANDESLAAMSAELARLDLTKTVTRVEVPVFFFLGRHDRQVDSRLAAAYFETLEAPKKRLVWFEESAHNVPFEEPEAFQRALVEALAPSPSAYTEP